MDVYQYREEFSELLRDIQAEVVPNGRMPFGRAVVKTAHMIKALSVNSGNKLIWIGNGGSAAIASHQSTDFTKQCRLATYVPSDFSLMTCMGNDYGYDRVFAEPIKIIALPGDVLVAISSSGRSPNILNGVTEARKKGCGIITLSGFDADNPLRFAGDVNFYVSAHDYRFVESAHLFICNCILEMVLGKLEDK